jgi:hypothetical protein
MSPKPRANRPVLTGNARRVVVGTQSGRGVSPGAAAATAGSSVAQVEASPASNTSEGSAAASAGR